MNKILHPYRSFSESAEYFPDTLLISQIKISTKILQSLCENRNSSYIKIRDVDWLGHEVALASFAVTCCVELASRNIRQVSASDYLNPILELMAKYELKPNKIVIPDWIPRDGIKEDREYINKLKGI
jgi:hypothetical protein